MVDVAMIASRGLVFPDETFICDRPFYYHVRADVGAENHIDLFSGVVIQPFFPDDETDSVSRDSMYEDSNCESAPEDSESRDEL
ncbi:unnamed protein product [Bemisia tabaci]|uniref:Uncharacterized protein n=1 Tax=Bemisia tabaci TaxID=7038 RepID=A0A9P0F8B7_BEMTA|nr:unnamed protein product [Bemisia tabaci]